MNAKIRDKINGSVWPVIISVILTINGLILGNLLAKVNKVYDTVIENKTRVDSHEKRLDHIEEIIVRK